MPDIMGKMDIAFPHLSIYIENLPKKITIFGFDIAFYGMILALSVLAGLLMMNREVKVTGQDPDMYWDFAMYAIFFSICGSRIYYVAFSWDNYKDNLLSIFNLREGGIAIYGTVIAAFITLFVYAGIKKVSPFLMADTGVPALILGQIIGRWANFMNRECFGGYTDNPLAMRLPIEAVRKSDISADLTAHIAEGTNYIQVHPTFLYESLWNVGILTFMMLYRKHKKFNGELALVYLGGYGLGRFWIEGLRTDQLLVPHTSIAVSQMLGITMFLAAVAADVVVRVCMKKKEKKTA
ncbi:MAG: prolipoprotein diacylglyceryl transferase [Roseburia sp.]|nr:prolipoprotein diacylglyceryl transferase [Roseburia sp.]MCM1278496.1 prolipoprotein diacylglyceryl transferase [Robinsoniella sp.]